MADEFVDVTDLTPRQRELLQAVVAQSIQTRVHAKRPEVIVERDELLDLARIIKNISGVVSQ
jgi:hypothetical protein